MDFKKMAVFCQQGSTFINPVIQYLKNQYRDKVQIMLQGNCGHQQFFEILNKSDLAWFEWLDKWCHPATTGDKYCKYIFRLHSYEAFGIEAQNRSLIQSINWNQVDDLILVNESVKDVIKIQKDMIVSELMSQGKQVSTDFVPPNIDPMKINVIPVGVDCKKFKVKKNKPITKKIAWLGYINFKKNFPLALETFKQLLKIDPEYELHIAGAFQGDNRENIHFQYASKNLGVNQQGGKVFFYGWIEPDKLTDWLMDKQYIVSSSLYESFHNSVAEGMAAGVIPLIYDWLGSRYIYPKEYIWQDIDEFNKLIDNFSSKTEVQIDSIREELHNFIKERYDYQVVFPVIKNLVDKHLYQKELISHFTEGTDLPDVGINLEFQKKVLEHNGLLK